MSEVAKEMQIFYVDIHFYIKATTQIHLRVSFIKQFINFMSSSIQAQSVEISGNSQQFYEVQQILKKNVNGTRYLIKWKGWDDPKDYTWQPLQHLKQVNHLIDEFNQKEKQVAQKNLAKANQQQKPKKAIQKEEEIQQSSSSSSQAKRINLSKDKEKVQTKKTNSKQIAYFPKICKNNFDKEKVSNNERKSTYNQFYGKPRQNLKDQISKYMIPINDSSAKIPESAQSKQKDKRKWFNQQPYRLGSIFRHVLEKDKLSYICNVDKADDLSCIAEVASRQLENIDKEMEKKYILDFLFNMSRENIRSTMLAYKQFEKSWKICK